MHSAVEMSNLNLELPLKDQDEAEVLLVVASVRHISRYATVLQNNSPTPCQLKQQYPFIKKYHGAWPVYAIMRQFLNNRRANAQAKVAAAAAEEGAGAPEHNDNENGDDGQGDHQSDASVSGIDNN